MGRKITGEGRWAKDNVTFFDMISGKSFTQFYFKIKKIGFIIIKLSRSSNCTLLHDMYNLSS